MNEPDPRALAPEPAAYDAGSIALHWALAALIVVAFFTGLYMADLAFSPLRFRLFNWHKWLGMLVLALSALRVVWRAVPGSRSPPPAPMPAWQLAAYRATHFLFYVLFFAVPLLGWAYTSAVGFPVVWFGILALPDFVGVDKPFGEAVLKPLHAATSYLLAALVVVHTGAALKHQLVDRDALLARIWPWWPLRKRTT